MFKVENDLAKFKIVHQLQKSGISEIWVDESKYS